MTPNLRFHSRLAGLSLLALGLGAGLGLAGRAWDVQAISVLSNLVSPLGALWMNALQMIVVPLVVALILAAIVRPSGGIPVGNLGVRSMVLFALVLTSVGVFTILVTQQVLGFVPAPPDLLQSLASQTIPAAMQDATTTGGSLSFSQWLVGLVPRNPLEAAVNGDILQVLIFAVFVGVAVGRLPEEQRDPLGKVFRSLADAMMVLVGWVIFGTPVGVFSIILSLTLGAGLEVVEVVAIFFFVVSGMLLLVTVALYPVASLFGAVSPLRFLRAALPAQIVAASTQSSLASLPALVDGGKRELDLPEESTGFVLPLCVSSFKVNQAVSPVAKVLFLAHIFGIHLNPGDIGMFLAGSLLIGFTSPGIPRGNPGFTRLPLYLAVGIPIEGYLMMEVVRQNPIFDACATVLNVTGDMAAATILSRGSRKGEPTPLSLPRSGSPRNPEDLPRGVG